MNNSPPEHAPLVQFPVLDDCLQIGGIALTRLVQRVGSTPFYAYDREKKSMNCAALLLPVSFSIWNPSRKWNWSRNWVNI